MSLLREARASGIPEIFASNPNDYLEQLNSLRATGALVSLDPEKLVAVGASVNLLNNILSTLPIDEFTGSGPARREVPKSQLLLDPGGDGQGWEDWAAQVGHDFILRGNAVGRIAHRDRHGAADVIVPQDLNRCEAKRDANGAVRWKIAGKDVPTPDVWHIRAFPRAGRIMGASPIEQYSATLNLSGQAVDFTGSFFEGGGHPTAVLYSEQNIDSDKAKSIKDRFLAAVGGRRRQVAVLGAGLKYQPIQVSPQDAAIIDAMRWSSAETARVWGPGVPEILGYETGSSNTYQNIEQRLIHLLQFAANPYLVRFEKALGRLLWQPHTVTFNRKAFLQTDSLTRFKIHEIALRNQIEVVNEVRALEELGPVAWGSEPNKPTPPSPPHPDDSPDGGKTE